MATVELILAATRAKLQAGREAMTRETDRFKSFQLTEEMRKTQARRLRRQLEDEQVAALVEYRRVVDGEIYAIGKYLLLSAEERQNYRAELRDAFGFALTQLQSTEIPRELLVDEIVDSLTLHVVGRRNTAILPHEVPDYAGLFVDDLLHAQNDG